MNHPFPVTPQEETTALPQGGCLSGFILPPLAVLGIGFLLTLFWLASGSATSGLAAAPQQANNAPAGVTPNQAALAAGKTGSISPVFPPEIQFWNNAIQTWAATAGLDPNLVATVMLIESCGNPDARSRAGAMGLFQVMPYHFAAGDDPYDPNTNATRGLAYLKRSLAAANGVARLALAGYNGGIGVIGRSEFTWAAETRGYASLGSGIYADASSGAATSLRLQEWLGPGGGMCRQARVRLGISQ